MFKVVRGFRLGATVGEVEGTVVLDVPRRLLEEERYRKGQPRRRLGRCCSR